MDDLLLYATLADQANRVSSWQPCRLGLVLPKKQARRSVTRSLLRHQAREALRRHGEAARVACHLETELDGWVLRLRAPFDRQQFPSAASEALNAAVRAELEELWSRLLKPRAEPRFPASAGGGSAQKTGKGQRQNPGAAA